MRPRSISGGLVAALFLSVAATALAGAEHCVPGDEVARRVDRVLKDVDWSDSLAELKEKAGKERKLIFWLQLVGELDGGL